MYYSKNNPSARIAITGAVATLVLLSLFVSPGQAYAVENFEAPRVYAVADIHGAYEEFVSLLQAAELVDGELSWKAEQAHLVITGDMVDRGPRSREVLDLLRELQAQAGMAGGMVHVLLGNHEVLNIAGDVSYVSDEAFAEFAEDATDAHDRVRESVWEAYEDQYQANRETFDAHYPPGFFAYLDAFAPDGEYGSWLLQQPLAVVVNDSVFVHAGLSEIPLASEADAGDIARYGELWRGLVERALIQPRIGFFEHQEALEALLDSPELSEDQRIAVAELGRLEQAAIFGPESQLWYRGNASCAAVLESDAVDRHLDELEVRRAVVGHTPTSTDRIQRRLDDRVILLDTGMLAERYYGQPSALLIEDDSLRGLYLERGEWEELDEEVRDVGSRRGGMGDVELESWLASATVVESNAGSNRSWRLVSLEGDGHEMAALWYPLKSSDADKALAAYHLDTLLGLELVPVAVRRSLDGKEGILQYVPAGAVTETQRKSQGLPGAFLCDLGRQYELMYVLDTLLYNQGRTTDTITYDPVTTRLLLVGNDKTFSRRGGPPPHLKDRDLIIPATLRTQLSALGDQSLRELIGELVGNREISALLKRRDYILESAP